MTRKRRTFTAEFKTRVALEALRGQHTIAEIAQRYDVHPNQVSAWKREAAEHLREGFSDGRRRKASDDEADKARLYQQIGQLMVELDWVKKSAGIAD